MLSFFISILIGLVVVILELVGKRAKIAVRLRPRSVWTWDFGDASMLKKTEQESCIPLHVRSSASRRCFRSSPHDTPQDIHQIERLDDKGWRSRRDCRHRRWPQRERPSVERSLAQSPDRSASVHEESVARPATTRNFITYPLADISHPLNPPIASQSISRDVPVGQARAFQFSISLYLS